MDLKQLRYFLAATEEEHFGRAARRLGITQPPLSRQIRALERELGVELFVRVGRGVRLTKAGQVLGREARAILSRADEAERVMAELAQRDSDTLTIGFVPSTIHGGFPVAVLQAFRRWRPDGTATLSPMPSVPQWSALRDGHIDVGFVYHLPESTDWSFCARHVWSEPLQLALPADHELAALDEIPAKLLSRVPFVWFPRAWAPLFYDSVAASLSAAGAELDVVQEAEANSTRLALVSGGVGATLSIASTRHVVPDGVVMRPLLGVRGLDVHVHGLVRDEPRTSRHAWLLSVLESLSSTASS